MPTRGIGPEGILFAAIVVGLLVLSPLPSAGPRSPFHPAPGGNHAISAVSATRGAAVRPEAIPPTDDAPVASGSLCVGRVQCLPESLSSQKPNDSWANVSALSPQSPPASAYSSMVYDAADGYGLLFGGLSGTSVLGYTWLYENWTWVNISASIKVPPSPRYGAAMDFDTDLGEVILFGGQSAAGQMLGDTWSFQAGTWTNLSGSIGKPPGPRSGASFAYDPLDKYSVLFGGNNSTAALNDTWIFESGLWHPLTPSSYPPARMQATFDWDSSDSEMVLFGGSASPCCGAFGDTWTFARGNWTKSAVAGANSPEARVDAAATTDPDVAGLLVYGGFDPSNSLPLQDTWSFSNGGWAELPAYPPGPLRGSSMIYDGSTHFVIMYGGLRIPWTAQPPEAVPITQAYGPWSLPVVLPLALGTHLSANLDPAPLYETVATQSIGGIPPYVTTLSWGDGSPDTILAGVTFSNNTHTYHDTGGFELNVSTVDATGNEVYRVLSISVGTQIVFNWLPPRDTYPFDNYESYWATGGDCYGVSSSEILYWEHDIAGWASAPLLPQTGATSTSQLVAPTDPYNDLNAVTLAIMDHQTHDPGNLDTPFYYLGGLLAMWYGNVQNDLAAGEPSLISLGNNDLHAVIVYGQQTYANGTVEFDISDPNVPEQTTHAWYIPSTESFTYSAAGFTWHEFAQTDGMHPSELNADWWGPSFLPEGWWTSTDYTSSSDGWYFVTGGEPLTVEASTSSSSLTGDDFFGVPGDSQSFSGGIAGSTGVEESDVQSYALPNTPGVTYNVVDPSNGTSGLSILLSQNTSGVTTVRGFDLTLNSSGEHVFNATPNPNGFTMVLGNEAMQGDVGFEDLTPTGGTEFYASGLDFPAGATVSFNVTDWSGLNGTTSPVEVVVTAPGGAPSTYHPVNGQVGWTTPSPQPSPTPGGTAANHSSAPAFYADIWFYGGLGAGFLIAVVAAFLVIRGRGGAPREASTASAP